MNATAHTHTIVFGGRVLAPGDTYTPFPGERPDYVVTFVGVLTEDGVEHVHLRDDKRAFSCPLSEIADAPRIPTLARLLAQAYVDGGMPNLLVTLPFGTQIPGVQHDDNLTAIAAHDLIDYLNETGA